MDNNPNSQPPIGTQNPQFQGYQAPQVPQQNSATTVPPPPPAQPPAEEGFLNKSNIIKIVVGIFVVLFFIFILFGLILPNLHKTKNEKVTLTYWGLWEDQRIMQGVISDFEKQNPNITVTYTKEDPNGYRQRLTTRVANGTGPDIFRFHNSWYPMLTQALLPIPSNLISKDQFSKEFYPVAQQDLIKNGAIYGVPLEIDTLSLYINTDILKSSGLNPPTTWEEFRDDSQHFTVKDSDGKIKTSGGAIGTFDNIDHASDIISLLFVQNGADLLSFTNYPNQVSDALKFYTSFSGNSWDSTLDPSILNFSKGNVAMIFGYSWDYFSIKALNPDLAFEVVPVPQLDKTNPKTIASYWAEGASIKSKHQKEALKFLAYLSDKTVQQKIYTEESKTRAFGEPYSNISLASALKDDPRIYPFVQEAPNAFSSYFVDSTQDDGLNSKLNTYLSQAINSMLGNTSPETATATLFQGYGQVLKEYGQ